MTCLTSLLVLVAVLTLFFISNAETEQSFMDPKEIELEYETRTDTLIQVLDPWIDDSGDKIQRYSLTNTAGTQLIVMSYGATITNLILGGEDGDDVVLGFDNIEQYKSKDNPYFGATVGRVANRIKEGHFKLNGVTYNLTINNGNNTLHGGVTGWDKKNWKSSVHGDKVVFNYVSDDGEEGFAGTVLATVLYSLTEDNTVLVRMTARTDEATPINIVNHAYYNLAGHTGGSHRGLYDHVVTIRAPWYTPVNAELIPTGDITPVLGTMFDLTKGVRLGNVINSIPGPTPENNGYDHNFAVARKFEDRMRLISVVEYPKKMRKMKIYSNQPGVQFYTGNFLPRNGMSGKNGANYTFHGGFCLETQNFPDYVNNPAFPDGILQPGQTYIHNLAIQIN